MSQHDSEFADPTTYMIEETWVNFSLPSIKSATVLILLGLVISCSLCVTHFLTQRERAIHKGTLVGFTPVSNADEKLQPTSKPRYPAVDYFRGLNVVFVVIFHLMWALGVCKMIPNQPRIYQYNLPITGYLCFAAIYSTSFVWGNLTRPIHPYIQYFIFSLTCTLCIYIVCWETERSGVCIIMLCVGLSLAIVHEDRIKWRNVIVRTLKLGAAAGAISAITYTFIPKAPIYFGAIHCIALNTLLTMFFVRTPRIALIGFICIQIYTMAGNVFPLEVPSDRPSADTTPWFHNLGYCLLGVWLHSVGIHKITAIELIPGKPMHLEDTVFTFIGRHALMVYLAHMIPVLVVVGLSILRES